MNWDQFKCSLCYLGLCGTVVGSLPHTQEIVGSSTIFYNFFAVNSIEFLQNFIRKNSNIVLSVRFVLFAKTSIGNRGFWRKFATFFVFKKSDE